MLTMLIRLLNFLLPTKHQIAEYYLFDGYWCRIFVDYTPCLYDVEPYIWEVYKSRYKLVADGRSETEEQAFDMADDFASFLCGE